MNALEARKGALAQGPASRGLNHVVKHLMKMHGAKFTAREQKRKEDEAKIIQQKLGHDWLAAALAHRRRAQ